MPDPIPLLACDYRGATPDAGRHYTCFHPRVCAPAHSNNVMSITCRDCEFSRWSPLEAVNSYKQRRAISPTLREYGERVGFCSECAIRRDNYCTRAAGACGLLANLAKSSFECPVGIFGRISRIDMPARGLNSRDGRIDHAPDAAAVVPDVVVNGAHAAADHDEPTGLEVESA